MLADDELVAVVQNNNIHHNNNAEDDKYEDNNLDRTISSVLADGELEPRVEVVDDVVRVRWQSAVEYHDHDEEEEDDEDTDTEDNLCSERDKDKDKDKYGDQNDVDEGGDASMPPDDMTSMWMMEEEMSTR